MSAAPSVAGLVETWRARSIDKGFEHYAQWAFLKCANELQAALPAFNEALTALSFAEGAIIDAISVEDGLDGGAGEAVLKMIRAALIANGREPITIPPEDEPGEPPYQTTEERLAALTAGGWQPIETHPTGRKVYVSWINELGNRRTTCAIYYEAGDISMDDDCDDVDEDGNNSEGGWFEDCESREPSYWSLNEPLTHWRPLPSAPTETKKS